MTAKIPCTPHVRSSRMRLPLARLPLILTLALLLAVGLAACSSEPSISMSEPALSSTTPGLAETAPTTPRPGLSPTAGVTDDRILFGQSAAFSGPAQELGLNMRLGIQAAFHEVNQRGGVHGRQLELTSLDDAYEPEAAISNTQDLIDDQEVFALIGAVGTPTSRSATPVAKEAGIPYMAPFTGAEFLRNTEDWDNIINLRASYYQETAEMVERLRVDLGIRRIAVVYQDDSYGRAGYNGVLTALDADENGGVQLVSTGVYTRNTTAVKRAVLDIKDGNPEAVIIIGAYRPVAALIAWARKTGLDAVFMTVSFVGSNALAEEFKTLGSGGAGVFVTQVVPFPTGDAYPVGANYRRALNAYAEYAGEPGIKPGFVSFEGYLAGRLAIYGLETCGPQVDRNCFMDALRSSENFDIDGFPLGYDFDDNQGSDSVFLTVIDRAGGYQPALSLLDVQQ